MIIPEHRLAYLLDQVKQGQINNCLYHNTATPPSLYCDHICERDKFPLRTILELDSHADEVWSLVFSHDGSKLASGGKDHTVVIYDLSTFTVLHQFTDHEEEVTYITWSPDDSRLISCSMDHRARVWDVSVSLYLSCLQRERRLTSALDWPMPIPNWSPT